MIEVEHLTKYYGMYPAVRDVTFNVERGEILGFLGPNGAGKTTTMRMITGYVPPTSGTVRVAGFDVAEKSLQARAHLGYLPETVPLYTELTTFEYLDYRARLNGLHSGRDRKARIYEVMDQLNLGDVSGKLVGALSRGYRQRVGLAQALLHNPDVLILDEPTVGLDPVQITEVRDMIRELGKNHTVVLSTHLLPEVSMVCNRVIIINRGKLVALDTPLHLAEGASHVPVVQLEASGSPRTILRALRGLPAVVRASLLTQQADGALVPASPVAQGGATSEDGLESGAYQYEVEGREGADIRAQVASAVVGSGSDLLELKAVRPSLEDVFIRVISQEEAEEVEAAEAEAEAYSEDEYPEEAAGYEEPEEEAAPVATRTKVTAKRRVRR